MKALGYKGSKEYKVTVAEEEEILVFYCIAK